MTVQIPTVNRTLREAMQQRLLAAPFDPSTLGRDELRARLAALLRDEEPLVTDAVAARVLDELVADVDGFGPLQSLLADPSVGEIMVNGPNRVWVERNGLLEAVACDLDADAIVRIAQRVIAPLGLRLDRAAPVVDARLADGSRLHAVLPPLAPDGPCVTIRRFSVRPLSLADFGLDPAAAGLLETMVRAGWNIVVAGATSAGKTTCVNALAQAIGRTERIVTIEETAELRLEHPHVVRLEARPANAEGAGAFGVRDLVRTSLRMRPDRVVVGEVRGGEAFDMLQALNTGHDGSLSTVHANSPIDALARLETLVLLGGVALPLAAVRAQITSAIDAIVQVARVSGGRREIVEVSEVGRAREGRPLVAHSLLVGNGECLAAVEAPDTRAATHRIRRTGGMVALRTILIALTGFTAAGMLASLARRRSVADRLRSDTAAPGRLLPGWLRVPLAGALDDAALTSTPEQACEVWLFAAGIAVIAGFGVAPAAGVMAGAGVLLGAPVALRSARSRRARAIAAAVPETLEGVGSELRSGGTVATALASVAHGTGPLATDIARLETRVHLGASLPDALLEWSRERPVAGVDATAGALALSSTVGGRAADALDALASSLRDRLAVAAEARALSAQARYSACVIGVAPIGYLVCTAAIDPQSVHALIGTNSGRACALVGVVLELLGATWMRAIIRSGDSA